MLKLAILATFAMHVGCRHAASGPLNTPPGGQRTLTSETYTNPILDGNYADPFAFTYNESFYLLPTMPDGSVSIFQSSNLADFHNSEPKLLWMPPNPPVWAPEMHRIDGDWYVYCALGDGEGDAGHRMHVLKGTNSSDPSAPFEDLGQITTPDENYAIDGTVLRHPFGDYFIWSGKDSPETEMVQYLYAAKMAGPTKLLGDRTVLHSPYNPDGSKKEWMWAPNGYAVNEGPEILRSPDGNRLFLLYSACGSWDPCYSLGIMSIDVDKDPLDPAQWWVKDDAPIFMRSATTVGVGHASLTEDASGVPYIVYHGWDANDSAGWGSRKVFAQKFEWSENGMPNLPVPAAIGEELPLPSGF